MGKWFTGRGRNDTRQIYQTEGKMNYSKTAIEKAVQAFQIIYDVTVTQWHCEKLLCLVGQAHEAEEAQHAATAPVVVPPPQHDPDSVAFPKAEYDACCGTPNTCEQPCFHRRATPEPAGDGWGPWIEWNGGDCPVDADNVVQIESRKVKEVKAKAGNVDWRHFGDNFADVVRYRVKL